MQNQKLSDKTIEVLVLLAMTLGLMVFGILNQSLDNYLEKGVYTRNLIRYWVWVLLISMGGALVWKALSILSRRYPSIYKRIQTLILLVLLIFNIYVAVVEVLSNFAWNWLEFHREEVYIYALQQSKLIGRTEHIETLLPTLFWRWEKNAVLPALSLGYGFLTMLVYIWFCWMWLIYSFRCMRHLRGEALLNLCVNEEKLLGLDLTSIVYLSALLPLIPMVIGQITPLFNLTVFYGGILFSSCDVAYLSFDPTEAGILQLLTMAYLLYQPRTAVQEERQSLPSGEDKESSAETAAEETAAEPAETVPETEEPVEAPKSAETPRELNMEDFQNAEFEYIYSDWDDEYAFPSFYVNTGWYYLTGGMTQPELMKEGKSIYVGNGDCLKQINPKTPEKGVCHLWQ